MRHGVVLLALMLGLAGCSKPAPSVHEREAQAVREVSKLTGWSRLFASPLETIGAINQAGFSLDPAPTTGGAYRIVGHAQILSSSFAKAPNRGNVIVAGSQPKAVDRVVYSLDLTDQADAATARDRLAGAIGDLLGRFKIADPAPLLGAIRAGKPATVDLAGLPVVVGATAKRLDVTFSRPAVRADTDNPAPAGTAKTQG